jgi:hypothetical protein
MQGFGRDTVALGFQGVADTIERRRGCNIGVSRHKSFRSNRKSYHVSWAQPIRSGHYNNGHTRQFEKIESMG